MLACYGIPFPPFRARADHPCPQHPPPPPSARPRITRSPTIQEWWRRPLCGNRLAVYVNLDGDTISEISFLGSGCAISKASASLMADAVKGKTLGEARRLFEQFLALRDR